MAYSVGGLISASDYNTFLNGTNQLNKVWSTGSGNAGYGQTAVSTVSTGGTVTATQWATLLSTLNNALTHQTGSGSGISSPTAGSTISYLSTLQTKVDASYTGRLSYATQGSTTTGSVLTAGASGGSGTISGSWTRTVTFASGDAARYFFNAGGQINWVITSVSNNNGTLRSADLVTQFASYQAGGSVKNNSATPRTGSGGTVNTNNTGLGYWSLTSSAQECSKITSANYRYEYNSDYTTVSLRTNGAQGANGDVGSVVYIDFGWYMYSTYAGLNDNVDVTVSHRIDIVYPETTYLTSTWGTATVS